MVRLMICRLVKPNETRSSSRPIPRLVRHSAGGCNLDALRRMALGADVMGWLAKLIGGNIGRKIGEEAEQNVVGFFDAVIFVYLI